MVISLFAYLRLDIHKKINYRAETGNAVQDVLTASISSPPSEAWYDRPKTLNTLDVGAEQLRNLVKDGIIEQRRVGRKNFYRADQIVGLQSLQKRSFDAKAFEPHYADHYLGKVTFYRNYGDLLQKRFDGVNAFSLTDAAKIWVDFRKRKEVIEGWKSIRDIWQETGSALSFKGFRNKYSTDIQQMCRCEEVSRTVKRMVGLTLKIHPTDAHAFAQERKREQQHRKELENEGMTIEKIAKQRGMGYLAVRNRLAVAQARGIVDRRRAGSGKFIIPATDVDALFGPDMEGYWKELPHNRPVYHRVTVAQEGSVRSLCGSARKRLRHLAGQGDPHAQQILFRLYEGIAEEAAAASLWGYDYSDRIAIAYTAIFEMIQSGDVVDRSTLMAQMKKRKRGEAPAWLSLDRRCGNDEGKVLSLGDLLTEDDVARRF
ncbi:MAG: hypothetical protein ACOCWQ_02535 [Nanoarchaeota archaeon]